MGTAEIIAIALSVLTLILLIAVILLLTRRKSGVKGGGETIDEFVAALKAETAALKGTINDSNDVMLRNETIKLESIGNKLSELSSSLVNNIDRQLSDIRLQISTELMRVKEENAKGLYSNEVSNRDNFDKTREALEKKFDSIQAEVNKNLDRLNAENQKKLDDMQKIIDEKLQSALEKRIVESFKIINDHMDSLNKSIGEVQSLSGDVKRFNSILSGTKQTGNWGEVMLESLIDQILSPEQYYTQYKITERNLVDFAIRMPGKGDKEVLLPIDCKFPIMKYEAVLNAEESGVQAACDAARRELIGFIKSQATEIKNKYIKAPKTTDFAVMYLPTESLFAEVMKTPGLAQTVQNDSKVIICGPTTISALLSSLQMGFKTLVIQKSSTEILKALTQFKKDFGAFEDIMKKTRKNAESIINQMDDGEKRTRLIGERLSRLDKYEPDKLLGDTDEE